MLEGRIDELRFRIDDGAVRSVLNQQRLLVAEARRLAGLQSCQQAAEDVTRSALKAGVGSIAGTVSDAGTGGGIEGIQVFLRDSNGDWVDAAWTDSSGLFSFFGLDDGTYFSSTWNDIGYINQLYSGLVCFECNVLSGTGITVVNGEAVTDINFALNPGAVISGTVTDETTGSGVADIWIEVYDASGSFVSRGNTDGSGAYTTWEAVPDGTYFVVAVNDVGFVHELYDDIPCPGYCDVTTGEPVVILGGGNVAGIDFALAPGGGVAGTVTDAITQAGIQDMRVGILIRRVDG